MNNQVVSSDDRWAKRQGRFLLDPLPIRLGELAVSLSGISSSAIYDNHEKIVKFDIEVSQHYLEWIFPDVDSTLQLELGELRGLLIQWRDNWEAVWEDQDGRNSMAFQAKEWAQKVLERSGLLDYHDWQVEFDYPPGIRAAAEALV